MKSQFFLLFQGADFFQEEWILVRMFKDNNYIGEALRLFLENISYIWVQRSY
jgi:hypothetical protein